MNEDTFNPAVIEMRGAHFASPRDSMFTVVEDVDWSVAPGEFWVIAGPQHSGKSDFLMHAAGLITPAHGVCRVFGCDTCDFGEAQLAERLRVGFVFSGGKLFNHLTIAENVALPLQYQKNLSPADAAGPVESLLEMLDLTGVADARITMVPAHVRLRAGLARALVLKPELLLLDNPNGGLTARQNLWLANFLNELWRGHEYYSGRPVTLVVATDDLRLWRDGEKKFAVLDEKRLVELGGWNAVTQSREPVVKELLATTDTTTI